MKLTKIEIKNFRLLTNVVLDIDNNMTLIVGKNNSGKTSFMNFLSLINENKIISFNDYPIIYRKELYNSIYSYLKSEITFEDMKKVIKTSSMTFYVNYKEDVSSDNFGFLSNFIIDIDDNVTDVIIGVKYEFNVSEDNFKNEFNFNLDDKDVAINKIKNILHDMYGSFLKLVVLAINPIDETDFLVKELKDFNNLFKIYRISAERTMGESDTQDNKYSPFSSLLTKLFEEDIDNSFPEMKEQIKELQNYVIDKNGAAENKINESLSSILKSAVKFGYPNEERIELKAHSNIQLENQIKKNTDLSYLDNESDEILPNGYNGLGYKNLLKIEFELAAFAREISNYSNSVISILFIEEPESHMHPQIQQRFIQYINDYIQDLSYKKIQVIITTHSSHISSEIDFDKIRYASRKNNFVIYKNLDNFVKSDGENLDFIKKYLTLTKCDMFFADKIILVEGSSEKLLIPDMIEKCENKKLFKNSKIPLIYQYYTILEVGGAYAHKFFKFVDFLEIPTLIITDIDSVKGIDTNNGRKYIKSLVSEGETTSNATIKSWIKEQNIIPEEELISIDKLLKLPDKNKTKKFRHIEFQVSENKYCGRSFEESIKNANIDYYGIKTEKDLIFDSENGKKTDFAIDLLMMEKFNVPKYIENGLIWLNNIDVNLIGDLNE